MHGRRDTWVDMACYGILLKPGCSSHRCIQHRLWHFRSATSSCPQCASLRWPRMVAIHSWQQRSPQLVEKPTLHEPSDPVSWWKCQLLLRCVEGRVPRTSMCNGSLPFYCRHVEPSNERVQDKCQTSHHIKWFKNHLKLLLLCNHAKIHWKTLLKGESTHKEKQMAKVDPWSSSLVSHGPEWLAWQLEIGATKLPFADGAPRRVFVNLCSLSGIEHQCD